MRLVRVIIAPRSQRRALLCSLHTESLRSGKIGPSALCGCEAGPRFTTGGTVDEGAMVSDGTHLATDCDTVGALSAEATEIGEEGDPSG